MPLPESGNLSFSQIAEEFDDDFPDNYPYTFSDFYRGGTYVPATLTDIPQSGNMSISDFYGAEKAGGIDFGLTVSSRLQSGSTIRWELVLGWNATPAADVPAGFTAQYQIQRKIADGTYNNIYQGSNTSTVHADTRYTTGTVVTLRMRRRNLRTSPLSVGDWTEFSPEIEHSVGYLLPVPQNLTISAIQYLQATATWDSVTAPSQVTFRGYEFRIKTEGQEWPQFGTTVTSPYIITFLQSAQTYETQIRATYRTDRSVVIRSAWTDVVEFTTLSPPIPTELGVRSITHNSAEIHWTGVTAPTGLTFLRYEYQEREPDAEWPTTDHDVTATSATFTNLEASTDYEARVRAVYEDGDSNILNSSWTSAVTFTTQGEPLTVVIAGPETRDALQLATYTATVGGTATGPISYSWFRRDPDDDWPVLENGDQATFGLALRNRGVREVRLTVSRGRYTRTSNVVTTTWGAAELTASISANETDPIAAEDVTFTCAAEGGEANYGYQWQRRQNGTGAWSNVGTNASYTMSATNQTWEVQCIVTSGTENVTTDSITITWPVVAATSVVLTSSNLAPLPGETVTITATVSGTTTGNITYTWGDAATGTGTTSSTTITTTITRATEGTETASISITRGGVTATDSIDIEFTTLPVPTGLDVRNITDLTAEIFWTAVAAPTGFTFVRYEYIQRLASAASWPSNDFDVVATSATFTSLTSSTAYQARVRAVYTDSSSNVVKSAWTSPVSFTTIAGTLTVSIAGPTARMPSQNVFDSTGRAVYVPTIGGTSSGRITYWWYYRTTGEEWGSATTADTVDTVAEVPNGGLVLLTEGSRDVRLDIRRSGVTRSSNVITTVWSSTLPDASAPDLTLADVADINENQTATITVTPSGGSYDTIAYTWVASSGTITGTGASVTYTPPAISSDTDVTITVDADVTGTGTNAVDETSDSTSSSEDDSVTFTVNNLDAIFNPPRSVHTENVTSTAVRVDWTAPAAGSRDDRGRAVTLTAYIGNIWETSGTEPSADSSVGTSPTHADQTGLTASTSYTYRLAARYGNSGDSAYVRGTVTTSATAQLPVASAPSLTIRPVSSVDENDTIDLTVDPTGGLYDTITYSWRVLRGGGTIEASGGTVTYTPPNVSSDTSVTVQADASVTGTGTNARAGTSDSTSSTEDDDETFTVNAVTGTFNPPRSVHTENITATSARVDWTAPATGSQNDQGRTVSLTAYIGSSWATSATEPTADSSIGTSPTHSDLTGLSPSTGYSYRIAARYGTSGDSAYVRGTFTTLAAPQLPVASAPSLSIGAVSSVDEDDTVDLTVTPSGGTYDTISYTWVVTSGGGTISGSGTTVTYNPPSVTSDTSVTVTVDASVTGTGSTARSGTSDSTSSSEDDSETFTVNNVAVAAVYNPPRNFRVNVFTITDTTAGLRWSAPADGSVGVGGATILLRRFVGAFWVASDDPPSDNAIVGSSVRRSDLTGLSPGTRYMARLAAGYSDNGLSEFVTTTFTTSGTAP